MHRVRLPKRFIPRFPAACVGCGRVEQERLRALGDRRIGSELALFEMGGPLGSARPLVMPVCSSCETETGRRTLYVGVARPIGGLIGACATVSTLAALGAFPDDALWGFLAFLVVVTGALLAAWCGHAFALHRWPPPVRVIGAEPRAIEFRDADRARAFAAANGFDTLPPSIWRL